jgi:riboflavin kinase/FMN adenylyltransferase
LQKIKLAFLKIYHSIKDFKSTKKTILTLGTFDGVHVGHQKIIQKLIQNASDYNCESLILTFFPHPRMVLQEGSDIKLLNTIDEKSILLKKMGLDNLIIHPFDKEFSRLTAEEFVKTILVDSLNIEKIIIGYDHRFGRNRSATIDDLILYGNEYNFEVEQISAQEIDSVSISSTKIRNAILDGNIALANEYLGYKYIINGTVIKGKQLGRTIGFPTANLKIEEDYKLIPKNGVYIVKSNINQKTVFGVMNIGTNPTVNGEELSLEVHFIDFDVDLYNSKIEISVLERIRDEQKFDSIELLKLQIQKDKETAISFIEKTTKFL